MFMLAIVSRYDVLNHLNRAVNHKAALNKYTVELVDNGSIVHVAPDKVKVSVPITGLQLPGWDDVKDTAGIARQLLKKTKSPQRLMIVATAGTHLGAKHNRH